MFVNHGMRYVISLKQTISHSGNLANTRCMESIYIHKSIKTTFLSIIYIREWMAINKSKSKQSNRTSYNFNCKTARKNKKKVNEIIGKKTKYTSKRDKSYTEHSVLLHCDLTYLNCCLSKLICGLSLLALCTIIS